MIANDKKTEIKNCIYDLYAADNQVPPHDVKIDQTAGRGFWKFVML